MSYTTVAYVREITKGHFVEEDDISDERIQDAIESADSEVNGYAAGTYAIPFTQNGVPVTDDKLLRKLSGDLAAYDITLTQQESTPLEDNDPIVRRYNAAIRTLQSVSTGKISWPYDSAATENEPASVVVVNPYDGDLFGPSDFAMRPAFPRGPDEGGRFSGRGWGPSGTW